MYCISEQQIDYILNDIGARGVEMEYLQLNLLDHICCIIEQQLEENGDFEHFYSEVIRKFYKGNLKEIEDETISLLTNKNYYVMKKIMIYSGIFSAAALSFGILFKYMYRPGASLLIVSGILTASLIFIPLLFVLKVKEKQKPVDRLLVGLGSLAAITIAMGILFKIMHWPGANALCVTSPAILALAFLPLYMVTGLRNPVTRVNTIVTSVLIVVGIGLFFSLTITSRTTKMMSVRNTKVFLRNEQILRSEQMLLAKDSPRDSTNIAPMALSRQVYSTCEELKGYLLEWETGSKTIGDDFEKTNTLIQDRAVEDYFSGNAAASAKLQELGKVIAQYNAATAQYSSLHPIPVEANVIDVNNKQQYKVTGALNDIIQIQMLVLQNQRALVAI